MEFLCNLSFLLKSIVGLSDDCFPALDNTVAHAVPKTIEC